MQIEAPGCANKNTNIKVLLQIKAPWCAEWWPELLVGWAWTGRRCGNRKQWLKIKKKLLIIGLVGAVEKENNN